MNGGGLAESARDIAHARDARIGKVGAAAEDLGRPGGHRLVHIDHERRRRVFDFDMPQRVGRHLGTNRGDGGNLLAGEADLVIFDPERRDHAALLLGPGQIDAAHHRMRVRAPQDRSVEHPGHLDVVAVACAAGRLERSVDARSLPAQNAELLAPLPGNRLAVGKHDGHVAHVASKAELQRYLPGHQAVPSGGLPRVMNPAAWSAALKTCG